MPASRTPRTTTGRPRSRLRWGASKGPPSPPESRSAAPLGFARGAPRCRLTNLALLGGVTGRAYHARRADPQPEAAAGGAAAAYRAGPARAVVEDHWAGDLRL